MQLLLIREKESGRRGVYTERKGERENAH